MADTYRVRLADHVVGLAIICWDVLHLEEMPITIAHQLQASPDGGQLAKGEHIDFHKAKSVDVVLVS